MTVIRSARSSDVSVLPEIERRAALRFAQEGLPGAVTLPLQALASHRAACEAGWLVVAADERDRPVGFALLQPVGEDLHLVELDVDLEVQGRGIGRALLDEVVRRARAAGLRRVTLTTYRDIPFNGPFYARYGFRALAPEDLDARLAGLRAAERAHGVELAPRVAMALDVGSLGGG